MGELQHIEPASAAVEPVPMAAAPSHGDSAILSIIERAARDPNVDIDKMERLMAMQERAVAQRAQAAFAAAFAEMQAELPSIDERGAIDHGGNKGKIASYALWEDINDAIKPVLAKHGFGLRFEPGRSGERLTVTGFLQHRGGHVEKATMELPADTSGSKNAVQAVGSSTSYGKRYVAAALLNLTSRLREDRDDDGAAATGIVRISEEQEMQLRDLIAAVGANERRFLQHLKVAKLADLPASRMQDAEEALDNFKRTSR